jgi:ABC-type branched-subunit amino acid transport system ATPase component/branched-subunit amino acid ABC-type transport system permease component
VLSWGVLALGVVNGLSIALLAVGLVLVYKGNRFINLAHAQMGVVPALLTEKFVLQWHWNWWLAFAVAIAIGIGTSLVIEHFLVRPLIERHTSRVRLMFLTLGVSQLLLALTFIDALGPSSATMVGNSYPQPFSWTFSVGRVVLPGMSILAVILVPLMVLVLGVFLQYSSRGKQIRAAAANHEAARLCGVPVNLVYALTWGLAGALATISAVLQAPSQPTFNVAAFGPYLLLLTVGAAAFGAFVSLPWALCGGLALGLIQQVAAAKTSDASEAELYVFIAIVLAVLVRGRALSRAFTGEMKSVDDQPSRRALRAVRADPFIRKTKRALLAGAVLASVVLPLVPYFDSSGNRFLLTLVALYAMCGIALTILMGWAGQLSLGHFAVVAIAAYLTSRWTAHGWPLVALLIVTAAIGAGVLVAVGIPALRVPGLTVVVTTLGLAVITQDWLLHQKWLTGSTSDGLFVDGISLGRGLPTLGSELPIYYVALAVLVLVVIGSLMLRRSHPARALIAVRDNERAAASFGLTPATAKLAALALTGALAAVTGVLWAEAWGFVSSSEFPADASIALLAVPVIGGLGSIGGSLGAAAMIYGSTFFVGPLVQPIFGSYGQNAGFQLFLSGLALVLTIMSYPAGLAGAMQEAQTRLFLRRAARKGVQPDQTPAADTSGAVARSGVASTPARVTMPSGSAPSGHASPKTDNAGSGLALEVADIHVKFGGVSALNGAGISVAAGEIVGLIGPNGAGKTTLMNVISGVVRQSGGSVRVFGNEVGDLPVDLRPAFGMARSFQDATLFPGLTVKEMMQLALSRERRVGMLAAMVGAPWVRANERWSAERADEVIDRFGLSDWSDALTSELSTGMRRVCDIAAQVATEPKLLLLDEPTCGVAQRDAEAFGPLLRRIRDELGCAVLVVEHDMPLLMGLCDRVYAMQTGKVIAEGSPTEIRENRLVIESYIGTNEAAFARSRQRAEADSTTSARAQK